MPDEYFAAYHTFHLKIRRTLTFSSDLSSLCCAKAREFDGHQTFHPRRSSTKELSPDVLRCSSYVS